MATDSDVWRVASMLIDTYGDDAPLYALASVDLLLERGDLRLASQWRCVSAAAATLLRERDGSRDTVH
jgi:hypothetical protein